MRKFRAVCVDSSKMSNMICVSIETLGRRGNLKFNFKNRLLIKYAVNCLFKLTGKWDTMKHLHDNRKKS